MTATATATVQGVPTPCFNTYITAIHLAPSEEVCGYESFASHTQGRPLGLSGVAGERISPYASDKERYAPGFAAGLARAIEAAEACVVVAGLVAGQIRERPLADWLRIADWR